MRSEQQEVATPAKSSPVLAIAIAVLATGLAVGIGVLVFVLVWPRGSAVGELSLLDANAAVLVDAGANDTLFFRTDVAVSVALISTRSDDDRREDIDEALRRSILTVRATSPSGVERVATCAVYNGRALSSTTSPGKMAQGGMLNDCALRIDAVGRWTVRASTAWATELSIATAILEVRREKGAP